MQMTLGDPPRCEVCGDKEGDLRIAPLMRPSDPPVICRECMTAWYESEETTCAGILKAKEILRGRWSADTIQG